MSIESTGAILRATETRQGRRRRGGLPRRGGPMGPWRAGPAGSIGPAVLVMEDDPEMTALPAGAPAGAGAAPAAVPLLAAPAPTATRPTAPAAVRRAGAPGPRRTRDARAPPGGR